MVQIPKVPKELQFIFAILALFIIIGFVIVMGLTIYKQAVNLTGLQQPAATGNCSDTDGGNNQAEFGTCIDSTRQSNSDTCVLTGLQEAYKLQEWFCENNTCKSEIKSCNPRYSCIVGKCTLA
jgi:hypothetical protein